MTPSTQDARATGLSHAHKRLLGELTRRWIKGTGFVHSSVVRDLIDAGLVEHRLHNGSRQIRALDASTKDQPHEA